MRRVEELSIRLVEVARTQQDGMQIFQQQLLQSNRRIEETNQRIAEMQSEIRGLQITANRILERLEQHMSNGHGG